jgi:hypothetical protein
MPYKPEYYNEGSFDDIYYLAENLVYTYDKEFSYEADEYLQAAINSLSNREYYGDMHLQDLHSDDYAYVKKRLQAMENSEAFVKCYMQNKDQYKTILD